MASSTTCFSSGAAAVSDPQHCSFFRVNDSRHAAQPSLFFHTTTNNNNQDNSNTIIDSSRSSNIDLLLSSKTTPPAGATAALPALLGCSGSRDHRDERPCAASKRGRGSLEEDYLDGDDHDDETHPNVELELEMMVVENCQEHRNNVADEDEEEALQELLEQRRRKRGPGVHWDCNGRAADLSAYIRQRASGNQDVQPPLGYKALNTDHYGCPCLYHSESGVVVKDEYPSLCRNSSLALLSSRVSYLYMSPEAFEEQCRSNRRGPQHRQECRSAPSADTWQWLSSMPPEAIRPVPSSEADMFSCDVELRFCIPVLHEVDDSAEFTEAMSEGSTSAPSSQMHDFTSLRLNSETFSEASLALSMDYSLQ